MKRIVLLLILVVLSFGLWANYNDAIIYPLSSSIYQDMDNLYALSSLSRPSTNRPWSSSEARMILDRVNKGDLNETALVLYNRIDSLLNEGLRFTISDDFSFDVGLDVSVEGYAHTNSTDYKRETDWLRTYNDRNSLLRLHIDVTSNDNFYTTSDIHYRYKRTDKDGTYIKYDGSEYVSEDGMISTYPVLGNDLYYLVASPQFQDSFATNVYFDTLHFAFIWPRRAVFSFGGDTWNFNISRDNIAFGNGAVGNLLVDSSTFNDFAHLSFFNPYFKYDSLFIFLNTLVNRNEEANTESKIYMIHTLQFRACDRFNFTISENVMYRYKTIDFSFFNPAYIYHNYNNREMFNALAYLDFSAILVPGLELYGQFALDQARAPHENDSQSDSYGFIGGLTYTQALKNGILRVNGEFVMNSPLLYRRDVIDFIKVTRYYVLGVEGEGPSSHFPIFEYIGFPYGGDVTVAELKLDYSSLDNWNLSLYSRFIQKGEITIFHSHNKDNKNEGNANISGGTPYGENIKRILILGSTFDLDLSSFFSYPSLSLYGEVDWIMRENYNKTDRKATKLDNDLQLSIGFTLGV